MYTGFSLIYHDVEGEIGAAIGGSSLLIADILSVPF